MKEEGEEEAEEEGEGEKEEEEEGQREEEEGQKEEEWDTKEEFLPLSFPVLPRPPVSWSPLVLLLVRYCTACNTPG